MSIVAVATAVATTATAFAFYEVVEQRLVIDSNLHDEEIRQLIRQWDTLQCQHQLTELEVDVHKLMYVWRLFATEFLAVALPDLRVLQLNSCHQLNARSLQLLCGTLLQANPMQTLSLCADYKHKQRIQSYYGTEEHKVAQWGELLGFPTCRIQKLTLSSVAFDARSFQLFTEGLRRHPVGMQRLTLRFDNRGYDEFGNLGWSLGDHDLAALVSALLHRSDTTLQSLSLQGARVYSRGLTRSSFAVLARLLSHCPLLEELQLSNLEFPRAVHHDHEHDDDDAIDPFLEFPRAVDHDDDDAIDPFLEFANALAGKQVFHNLSLKQASCLDQDDLHTLLEALTAVKTLKTLDISGIRVSDVTMLLVLYLPRLNGLEILRVDAPFWFAEGGALGHALRQNSSLLTLGVYNAELSGSPNRSSNSIDGRYAFVCDILQRNAVLRGLLVLYLDNRRLSPSNWPLRAGQLLAACKDVTPLFLFLRATANYWLDGSTMSEENKCE